MGASYPAQVRALLVKSAVYQRRNSATNACLVVAPIFFCGLLALLQVLVNKLILSQRINQCGCQCTRCCVTTKVQLPWTAAEMVRIANGEKLAPRYNRTEECNFMDTGYCERYRAATCRAYNDSNCSLRFSSPRQAIFCAIPKPSSWPPVMQSPRPTFRAGGPTTQWLPFTGTNRTAARAVAANLVLAPELPNLQAIIDLAFGQPLSLLSLQPSQVLALVLPFLARGGLLQASGESVDAAQLSRLELKFGSPLAANNDYYLESAFINSNTANSRLQLLVPQGRCSAAGLSNATTSPALPLVEMLLRYYNASFPLVIPPLLQLFNVTPSMISEGLDASQFGGITAACVDMLPREADNVTVLDRRLYCGFGKARCDGTYFIREYGGAFNFRELSPTALKYDAHYNLSLPLTDDAVNYRINELLNMAAKAWTLTYWGTSPVVYARRNRLMGLMSFPKTALKLKLDFSVVLGPLFYTWVIQMLMPSLLQQLVYEKEKRLRMMMKMHGLGDGAYWLVTYLWYLLMYIVYMIFFVVFGTLIRLKIFTTSSMTLQAVLYFIFGNNMLAFVFMISPFFSSSRTATVVAFLYIFATGLIGELLLRSLMQQDEPYMLAVQLLPGFALYRGLFEFSEYSLLALFANVPGLRWANLRDPGNGMIAVWVILVLEWPLFMALAWYFEQVLDSGAGVRRHPLFFLQLVWRKPGADLGQRWGPEQGGAVGAAALGSAVAVAPSSFKVADLELPPRVEGMMPERIEDSIASARDRCGDGDGDADGNGNGCADGGTDLHRRSTACPIAEAADICSGEGGGDGGPFEEEGDRLGSRGGGGGSEKDNGIGGDGGPADEIGGVAAVTTLPGCPMEHRDSSSGGGASGAGGNASGEDGCVKANRGGDGSGGGGGGGSSSSSSGGPAGMPPDLLVASAVPVISPPRRLLTSVSSHSINRGSRGGSRGGGGGGGSSGGGGGGGGGGSSGGGGGGSCGRSAGGLSACGREPTVLATCPAATPVGSPRGGGGSSRGLIPRGGASSPANIAWAAATEPASSSLAAPDAANADAPAIFAAAATTAAASASPETLARIVIDAADQAQEDSRSSCKVVQVSRGLEEEKEEEEEQGLGRRGSSVAPERESGGPTGCADVTAAATVAASNDSGTGHNSGGGGGDAIGLEIQADDVAAEAARVVAMDDQQLTSTPIVVLGLAKVFPKDRAGDGLGWSGGLGWGGAGDRLNCCCTAPRRTRVAVRSLTLAIERGECFGLLGPNGAGKTTSINMLTGFLEPSGGDALVEGRSVRTRMQEIYRLMGVCPQENLLWDQLTGEEHLRFYGRLKGLAGKELSAAVDAALKSVKLHVNDAGKRRVVSYSGGMKRRLSVAISFIGNPQVVYLDEPSTGLDPASRRALWDVVREQKVGRAIILTTHSMEEAEILCDRLGIFVDGQLVCIGNPREITSRYAGYFVFTITIGPSHEEAAKAFVAHMSPHARLTYALGGTFKYELPADEVSLSAVFRAVAAAKEQMQILDWGVANATLEEVFIKFARQIGVETRDQ